MKIIKFLCLINLFLGTTVVQSQPAVALDKDEIFVPIGGNSYEYPKASRNQSILQSGKIDRWNDASKLVKTFIRFGKTGDLKMAIDVSSAHEGGTLLVTFAGKTKQIQIDPSQKGKVFVSDFQVRDTGYYPIEIKAIAGRSLYPTINGYFLSGSATASRLNFVKDNADNFFYWGRRGPSTHMSYQQPKDAKIEYYYNEVTVPSGSDIEGSYFMSNGFNVGYFGMQVNSPTERRILFSVWSPFSTDNPKDIPDDQKIVMTRKGENVYTGEFGNEGSGGQSYLKFNWIAGNTYKFLLKGTPIGNNHTEYTAWFYAPEVAAWKLIAQFNRPQTNAYLSGFHSFLENFNPDQGIYQREVQFSNQWVIDVQGKWHACTQGRFTVDNTGRKGYRMDYAGGVNDKGFFLRNFGFFKDYVPVDTKFQLTKTNAQPQIDFKSLPLK